MHTESVIEAGRSAFQRGDWGAAYAALTAADDDAGLPIEDLERLATTAYLVGDEHRFVELMSRVHREAMQAGDPVTAAHAAFWVAFSLSDRGHTAQASGWLSRGEAALGSTPGRSAAQGYLLALRAVQQNAEGEPQAALEMFTEVHEYGRRFADPDLLAFGRLGQGQALVMLGKVEQGVSYLDEVMVAVTAEEVSAMVSGLVYCGVIEACHSTFDVGRAREWTGALTQWCDKQPDLVPYRGDCLVHRAQILQLNGNWALAMNEADRARALLAPLHGNPLQGAALYEKACPCVGLPELHTPAADRLMRDDDPALEHELLDLAETEREAEVQPHTVGDGLDRVPVPLVRRRHDPHEQPLPHDQPEDHPTQSTNVTAPAERTTTRRLFGECGEGECFVESTGGEVVVADQETRLVDLVRHELGKRHPLAHHP
jgi:hypothetical protein